MTNGEFTRITKDAQQRGNLGLNIDEARKVVGHFAAGAPWTVGFSVAVIEFATLRKEISWMRTAAWDRYAIKVPSDAQNRNLCIEVKKVKVKNAAIYCQTSVTRLTESDWAHKKKHPAVLVRACDCAECQQKQQQKQQQRRGVGVADDVEDALSPQHRSILRRFEADNVVHEERLRKAREARERSACKE